MNASPRPHFKLSSDLCPKIRRIAEYTDCTENEVIVALVILAIDQSEPEANQRNWDENVWAVKKVVDLGLVP